MKKLSFSKVLYSLIQFAKVVLIPFLKLLEGLSLAICVEIKFKFY